MLYFAGPLLKESERKELRKALLMASEWEDGKNTASGSTKDIKKNLQLISGDTYEKYSQNITKHILSNLRIHSFAFPAKVFQILFTRTGPGMFYGPHVDLAFIGEKRRDLSFTIFLNDPKEYKGGELVLYIPPETRTIKLDAGQIIIYPTKYLHEVKKVTEGERMVCVGWIQSQVIKDDDRELLEMIRVAQGDVENSKITLKTKLNLNSIFNRLLKRFSS